MNDQECGAESQRKRGGSRATYKKTQTMMGYLMNSLKQHKRLLIGETEGLTTYIDPAVVFVL